MTLSKTVLSSMGLMRLVWVVSKTLNTPLFPSLCVSEDLTKALTFLYNGYMIKKLRNNGLLDADFLQPLLAITVLLVLGEVL